MRNACWIPKTTNTHSEHVTLTVFPLQQWLHERACMLRYTYIGLSSLTCYQYANKREGPKLSVVYSIISILPGEEDDFAPNYRKSSEYADYNNLEHVTAHII